MAAQNDPANWLLTHEHPSLNIVFFEPAGIAAVYLAIYRITNESEFDIEVVTAAGRGLLLPAKRQKPSSIDVSSTSISLRPLLPLEAHASAAGTYRNICCSLAQSSATFHTTNPTADQPGSFDPLQPRGA